MADQMPTILLASLGTSFLCVSALILRKQSKASQCDLHNRKAGQAAVVLGIATAIAGVALVGFSVMLLQQGV